MGQTQSLFLSFNNTGRLRERERVKRYYEHVFTKSDWTIKVIRCESHNLRSLEGCPNGLKKLAIGCAPHLSYLSPLASCSMMESLEVDFSSITNISIVSLMPLLKGFSCRKALGRPSIKDLSPLSSCPRHGLRLKRLEVDGNNELDDLSLPYQIVQIW